MIMLDNKILIWNFRGAANKAFYWYNKQYIDMFKPSMFVIMEIHCNSDNLNNSLEMLGFDGIISMQNQGFAGGIMVA